MENSFCIYSKNNLISPIAIFKKTKLTIDPLSLGIYAPGPQVSTYRPEFSGRLASELRSGPRARNGELKGSGVLGTEGYNSPFRGA